MQPLAQPCPCCGGRMFVIETFEAGAASHVTGQPRLSSQSRSTAHDREHNLPHHRALSAMVLGRTPIPWGSTDFIGRPHGPYREEDEAIFYMIQGLKLKDLEDYVLLPVN